MWAKLLLNKYTIGALLIAALGFMAWLYNNEREKRQLEHEAHAVALELATKEILKAKEVAEYNAAMVQATISDMKRFEQATKDAYEAAEIARKDASYLRERLKYHGKTSPAFAHCLDIALPDELQLVAPARRNNNKSGSGKSQVAGKSVNTVPKS